MNLTFVSPSGYVLADLTCQLSQTVRAVKWCLAEIVSAPVCLMTLVVRDSILKDSASLSECGITGDVVVTLIRESAARISTLPEFCGIYQGIVTETTGEADPVTIQVTMDSLSFAEIGPTGWRGGSEKEVAVSDSLKITGSWDMEILTCPSSMQDLKGARGSEYFSGAVSSNGLFLVSGYQVVMAHPHQMDNVFSCDVYRLQLSPDGSEIRGAYVDGSVRDTIEGEIVLHRLAEVEVLSWRKQSDAAADLRSSLPSRVESSTS